ncbi:MAG: carboxypeptidase-like regulatory domain-containing protein [Acidobacteriota bacterium]
MNQRAFRMLIIAAFMCGSRGWAQQTPPGSVTLPLPEYNRLLELAKKAPRPPERPPIAAALTEADIRGTVEGDRLHGTMRIYGEVFQKGPTEVRLVQNTTLFGARLGGRPLPLWFHDNGCSTVLDGPASFSVELDWETPVSTEPGRATFQISAPDAAGVHTAIEIPAAMADAHVERGIITGKTSLKGKTTVEATLEPGRPARFWWSSRETTAAAAVKPVRFLSDIKTLVTIGEADISMAALVDVTVLQGDPVRFNVRLPERYEVTGATGSTVDATEQAGDTLAVVVRDASRRRRQFLVTLERPTEGGSLETDAGLPVVEGSQRETGDVAVEGAGTMELTVVEGGGMQRVDVRECAGALRALARYPLLAAFRYQRKMSEPPALTLGVKRFLDAPVLAAVAESAEVTTLVTAQGRMLTEVSLTVRNHTQPYLKVGVPDSATLLSAEVAGEAVKPVKGKDGTRVPLLRPGYRPDAPYRVSYVYMDAGAALGKAGTAKLAIPQMDIPVLLLRWEMMVPDQYKARDFGGEAIQTASCTVEDRRAWTVYSKATLDDLPDNVPTARDPLVSESMRGAPGDGTVTGTVVDQTGGVLPGATVTLTNREIGTQARVTGINGDFAFPFLPSGDYDLQAELDGFATYAQKQVHVRSGGGVDLQIILKPTSVAEVITVTAEQPIIDTKKTGTGFNFTQEVLSDSGGSGGYYSAPKKDREREATGPSSNVLNLQKRVSGVLPIRVEIPRAGVSYRFIRSLVLDEETTVTFEYKRR